MAVDIRLPKITEGSEREQLTQVKSYLYQLVEQLNFALNSIDSSSVSGSGYIVMQTPSVASSSSSSTSVDGQATFNAIKGLIIKSADIVEAYYDEINSRLEGIYVAESDFGAYMQKTSQDIDSTSQMVDRSFTNVQEITSKLDDDLRDLSGEVERVVRDIKVDLDNITHTLIEVNANIRTGLLYYDDNEIPIYGLEVGQRTKIDGVEVFNKYARFTAAKLSFYDQNGAEVAYISDRKLYINHVEVTGTFRMGGFVRTVLADGSIVKRWLVEGGEG